MKRLSKHANMQSELQNINTRIKFLNCMSPMINTTKIQNTMYGQFIIGSTLSIHLSPI